MCPEFIKTSYAWPTQTLPSLSLEHHLADMQEFAEWIESVGIRTANTRISRYIRYLDSCRHEADPLGTSIFHDHDEHPFKSAIDRYLYVLREVHELMWIFGGIKINKPKGIENKLRIIVGGSDFAALDQDSTSRNIQFELRIASYFCREGYLVDLSSETTDIIASKKDTFHTQCKRIASERRLARRTKEAERQHKLHLPRSGLSSRNYGIVALDVTKLAFDHNGLTWGMTAEHSRDVIREKLVNVSTRIEGIDPANKNNKYILLTWLQVHMPSLVRYPPQCTTRFSSHFRLNPTLGGRRQRAFNRLRAVLETGANLDSREVPPRALTFRKGFTVPAGSVMKWDNDLLGVLVTSSTLPDRSPDHVVLSLEIEGTKHEFCFYDLAAVVKGLDGETRGRMQGNETETIKELLGRLLRQAYPYEDYGPAPDDMGGVIE